MPIDAIKTRFVDEIKLRGYDDKYIDINEEREILQIAIHQGIGIEAARAAFAEVCVHEDFVVESVLLKLIQEKCQAATANGGMIDQAMFERIVELAKKSARERKSDRDIRKLIVTVMEDHGLNRISTGWFKNWYAALKKELGVA
jgi:hypothetical protein